MQAVTSVREAGERCWSTRDVEPSQALAYWFDAVCRNVLELEISCPTPEDFMARIRQTPFGPGSLVMMEAGVQDIMRTRSAIARSTEPTFHLHHLRDGAVQIEQYGRVAQLRGGDCVLLDSTEPCKVMCPLPTRSVAIVLPQSWLRTWLPVPENLVARALAPGKGWASALTAAMASLQFESLDDLALPRHVVAEQIAVLLALSAGPAETRCRARDKLYDRILQALQSRCHELDLSPAQVASAHSISKRYLHQLFASAGTTFGRELTAMRLALARRMLGSPRFARLSIGEIAARSGFHDASHFARRFRQQFGCAPTSWRNELPGSLTARETSPDA